MLGQLSLLLVVRAVVVGTLVDLGVVQLQDGHVVPRLDELLLLERLLLVPVHKRPLREHQVELLVQLGPGLGDGGGVGEHTDGSLDRRHVPVRRHARSLVVDAHLRRAVSSVSVTRD